MQTEKIWLLIPAHNEAATIATVIEKFSAHFKNIIVVDDGSDDDTQSIARSNAVIVLTHAENLGKAAALMTGFRYVLAQGAEVVVTVDADDQHDPIYIPTLLDKANQYPNALIIAARFFQRQNAPKNRYIANRIADFWLSWATGQQIWDSQSGYRLYPASLLRKINIRSDKAYSFVFESEILITAANLHYPIIGVPTAYHFPEGLRKSHFQPGHDIWLITKMIARHIIRKKLFLNGLWLSLTKKNFFRK